MEMEKEEERNWYQPPRRKTPSFSSSLLDSILRSIDETNQQQQDHHQCRFFPNSEPKQTPNIQSPQTHHAAKHEHSLRSTIMIDQWMETHNNNSNIIISNLQHGYNVSRKISPRNFGSDSSSSGTTTTTFTTSSAASFEQPETPSTYRSLPNSFTVSRKQAEAIFLDDSQKLSSATSIQFIKSTKIRAMKIYGDLKKVKQPICSSPGTRISTFLYSLFASPKKSKLNQTLKKSRSIKQDSTCTSFSRSSCMSKKQHNNSGLKRSVRFYPEINDDTLNLDRKSINERVMPLPKYERRRTLTDNCRYMKNYKKFMQVNVEEDDDEDDLFELEIVGGVAYGRELPVFETTDLTKIRI